MPASAKTPRSKARFYEAREQRVVIRWAHLMERHCPRLDLLHAIPNGGRRNRREAALLKAEGVKAGVSDLCLPVRSADGKHIGLYIEMKWGKNTPTSGQKEFLRRAGEEGHRTGVCYSADAAVDLLREHLGRRDLPGLNIQSPTA